MSSATLALHLHRLSVGRNEGRPEIVAASMNALQDLARTMTLSAKSTVINPNHAYLDSITFWAHSLYAKSALIHIKYNIRDHHWAGDLEVLKNYLQYLAPRYKIHRMCP